MRRNYMETKDAKIQEIVSAYRDYKNSPFSDGYSTVALENKYLMSIEEIKAIYENNRVKRVSKESTEKKTLDLIKKAIDDMPYDNMTTQQKAFNSIKELVEDFYRK